MLISYLYSLTEEDRRISLKYLANATIWHERKDAKRWRYASLYGLSARKLVTQDVGFLNPPPIFDGQR